MNDRGTALLVAGNGFSLLGDGMFVVAIGFAVLAVGGGAGALGVILLAGVATIFLCVLPAGVLVDRTSRKNIVVGADVTRGLLQLAAAAIIAVPGAQWWYLIPTSIIFGAASALHQPAMMALIAEVSPREQLEKVNGAIQALRGVGLVVGSAIAGVIVSQSGPIPVMLIDAVTFFACSMLILAIRVPVRRTLDEPLPEGAPVIPATHIDDIREAVAEVRRHRWLVHGLIVIAGFVVVSYAPIQVVGPAAAESAAGSAGISSAQLWAWMSAATAVGMIIGGVTAFVRPPSRLMTIIRILLVAGGLGPIGFAAGVSPLFTLPGFAMIGGAMGLFASSWEAVKQARIEQKMLARVASLDMFAQLIGMIIGVVAAAATATFIGVDTVLYGIGGGCMVLAALSALSSPLSAVFRDRASELIAATSRNG